MENARPHTESIFYNALLRSSPVEREAYLADVCHGDAALRAQLERLLRAYDGAGGFLRETLPADDLWLADDALESTDARPAAREAVGTRVGRYKLLQQIGEGGFGVVFLAEQCDPVQRRVALKVIKLGMDTKQVIARFEAERQALALMDHPHIARVLDAGATDSQCALGAGRPFFVMELVKGAPITRYCDENQLAARERLALFADVCSAVQHAHQKGVIHRDLKPSNVLVSCYDGKPVVKIIDFGIAKAVAGRLTEKTLFTEMRQLVGTPAYMSPEQTGLSDLDIDTRSDIYSLGILLYELLTGTTPFDSLRLRDAGLDGLRRIICAEEPPRPSLRVAEQAKSWSSAGASAGNRADVEAAAGRDPDGSSLAAEVACARRTDPRALVRLLRGDLDWIIMKCLEKDRQRRYETANGLWLEIGRYLAGEPVLAAPPGMGYRLRKFAVRRRGVLSAAAVVVLALIAGIVGTAWQAARATDERDQAVAAKKAANLEAEKARAVQRVLERILTFPQSTLAFSRSGPPEKSFSPDVKLIEVIDEAARSLEGGFVGQPEIEADVRYAIGKSYFGLSRMADSRRQLTRALELYREHLGEDDLRTIECLHMLGWATQWVGDFEEAASALRGAAMAFERKLGPRHDRTISAKLSLVMFLASMVEDANPTEIEGLAREALALRRESLPESSHDVIMAKSALAFALTPIGKVEEALTVGRNAVAALEESAECDESDEFHCRLALGNAALAIGQFAEAEEQFRANVRISQRLSATNDLIWAAAHGRLGCCLWEQKRWPEAETMLREAVSAFRTCAGAAHPYTLSIGQKLATACCEQGKLAEGAAVVQELVDGCVREQGWDAEPTLRITDKAVRLMIAHDLAAEAEPLARQLLERRRRSAGSTPLQVVHALYLWAQTLEKLGMPAMAEQTILEALQVAESGLEPDNFYTHNSLNAAGNLMWARGDFAGAAPFYGRALEIRRRRLGPDDPVTLWAQYRHGWCLWSIGRRQEGEALLRAAVERLQSEKSYIRIGALFRLAIVTRDTGALDESDGLFGEMVAACHSIYPGQGRSDAACLSEWGDLLLEQRRFAEAESLLTAAADAFERQRRDLPNRDEIESLRRLTRLYEAWHTAEPDVGHDRTASHWCTVLAELERERDAFERAPP